MFGDYPAPIPSGGTAVQKSANPKLKIHFNNGLALVRVTHDGTPGPDYALLESGAYITEAGGDEGIYEVIIKRVL